MSPSPFLFPHSATLEVQTGTSGQGEPLYGPPVEFPCLLVRGLRQLEGREEREEVVTETAYCPATAPADVPTGSRLTVDGRAFVVVEATQWRFPGRGVETVELRLGKGPLPAVTPS